VCVHTSVFLEKYVYMFIDVCVTVCNFGNDWDDMCLCVRVWACTFVCVCGTVWVSAFVIPYVCVCLCRRVRACARVCVWV